MEIKKILEKYDWVIAILSIIIATIIIGGFYSLTP